MQTTISLGSQRRRIIGAVVLAAAALSLTACGDQVTAARDFYSYAHYQASQANVAGQLADIIVAEGPLAADKDGVPAPATLFRERCTRPVAAGAIYTCVAIVNTGQRIYIARAATLDPIEPHTLAVIAGPHGSVTITSVGTGMQSHDVKISLRP